MKLITLTWELTSMIAAEFEFAAHAFLYFSMVDFMLKYQQFLYNFVMQKLKIR